MQLSRAIGFFYGNVFLLSSMIGSGILVSPKGILKFCSMNIPLSLGIWAASAILIMMYALCVAEIATTFPVSAASYYFLKRSFGPCVAFLSLWIRLFAYPLGLAAQCLISSSYLIQPFYVGCSAPELPKKCLALAILWSLGILNARGMTTLSWFQSVSSLMKMAFLSFISLTGIVLLVTGKKENVAKFENALDAELPDVSHIIEAFLQGFYAYYGYTVLTNLAGEVKNPSKTIPRSVISALSIVAVIYLLTNISFLAVLTPQEIISSGVVALCIWIVSFVLLSPYRANDTFS
ncbi:solute carrier family 7 member 12-like isoform 2-T2 [Thomomys bottae]